MYFKDVRMSFSIASSCPQNVLVYLLRLLVRAHHIYSFLQNTVKVLEHTDKDSNFASQCTSCRPLMANGVNNYKASLR